MSCEPPFSVYLTDGFFFRNFHTALKGRAGKIAKGKKEAVRQTTLFNLPPPPDKASVAKGKKAQKDSSTSEKTKVAGAVKKSEAKVTSAPAPPRGVQAEEDSEPMRSPSPMADLDEESQATVDAADGDDDEEGQDEETQLASYLEDEGQERQGSPDWAEPEGEDVEMTG